MSFVKKTWHDQNRPSQTDIQIKLGFVLTTDFYDFLIERSRLEVWIEYRRDRPAILSRGQKQTFVIEEAVKAVENNDPSFMVNVPVSTKASWKHYYHTMRYMIAFMQACQAPGQIWAIKQVPLEEMLGISYSILSCLNWKFSDKMKDASAVYRNMTLAISQLERDNAARGLQQIMASAQSTSMAAPQYDSPYQAHPLGANSSAPFPTSYGASALAVGAPVSNFEGAFAGFGNSNFSSPSESEWTLNEGLPRSRSLSNANWGSGVQDYRMEETNFFGSLAVDAGIEEAFNEDHNYGVRPSKFNNIFVSPSPALNYEGPGAVFTYPQASNGLSFSKIDPSLHPSSNASSVHRQAILSKPEVESTIIQRVNETRDFDHAVRVVQRYWGNYIVRKRYIVKKRNSRNQRISKIQLQSRKRAYAETKNAKVHQQSRTLPYLTLFADFKKAYPTSILEITNFRSCLEKMYEAHNVLNMARLPEEQFDAFAMVFTNPFEFRGSLKPGAELRAVDWTLKNEEEIAVARATCHKRVINVENLKRALGIMTQ